MKSKRIKTEKLIETLCPHYKNKAKRNIKDIQNNTKHSPKGQR